MTASNGEEHHGRCHTHEEDVEPQLRGGRPKPVDDHLERLNHSIDAAEAAAKDLRSGVERGTRDLVRDLERTLKHTRANARRVSRAVAKDLKGIPARRPASRAKRSLILQDSLATG